MSCIDPMRQLSKQRSILEQQQQEEEKKQARRNVLIEEEKAATGIVRHLYQVLHVCVNRHTSCLCVILIHLSHVHVTASLNMKAHTPVQVVYIRNIQVQILYTYVCDHSGEDVSGDFLPQSLHILHDWSSHPVQCADQCIFSGL